MFEPTPGLFWKVGSFFLQVGAQFGGTELMQNLLIIKSKLFNKTFLNIRIIYRV